MTNTKRHTKRHDNVYCSSCGGNFGPGDHGFSHCEDHADLVNEDEDEDKELNKLLSEGDTCEISGNHLDKIFQLLQEAGRLSDKHNDRKLSSCIRDVIYTLEDNIQNQR